MSQEEFGLYGYLFAMVTYLATLLSGGFYLIQSKLYFQYPEEERGAVLYSLNITLFAIVFSILGLLVAFDLDKSFFLLLFKHPLNYSLFRWSLLAGVVVTICSIMITYYFLASSSIKKLQLFNILRSMMVHAVAIFLLYRFSDWDGAYIRISSSYFTELLLAVIFIAVIYKSIDPIYNRDAVNKAMALALPITIYTIFSLVIFLSDRFFIERLGSLRDLAVYNLAWVLAGVIPFISNSIHSIWLPELLKEEKPKMIALKARAMGLKLLAGFAIISIGMMVMTKFLLAFSIIDKKYEEVIPILPIVLFGSSILSVFQLVFNYLLSISRIAILSYISFFVALAAVWLTRLLVLKWGVYGAALSMVIMNLGLLIPSLIYSFYFYKKTHTV